MVEGSSPFAGAFYNQALNVIIKVDIQLLNTLETTFLYDFDGNKQNQAFIRMQNTQFEDVLQKFQMRKKNIPEAMKIKLQYMILHIKNKSRPFEQLSEQQQILFKDIYQLSSQSLKIVFISVMTSILDPQLYSSFEKNCKIKLASQSWIRQKWKNAYIDFGDSCIYFNQINKTLRFGTQGLTVRLTADKKKRNDGPKRKIEFLYNNKIKAITKFQNQSAAKSILARINLLIGEKIKQKSGIKPNMINQLCYIVDIPFDKDYNQISKGKNILFYAHKSLPKIWVQLFLKTQQLKFGDLIGFLIEQKCWNTKVKHQKISKSTQMFEMSELMVERDYESLFLTGSKRKSYTKLKISLETESNEQFCLKYRFRNNNPKYMIIEQDISQQIIPKAQHKGFLKLKSSVICCLNSSIIIQNLGKNHFKIAIFADFDGKGNCTVKDSQSYIINIFSDTVFMPNSIHKKHKKKTAISKEVSQAIVDKLKNLQKIEGNIDFYHHTNRTTRNIQNNLKLTKEQINELSNQKRMQNKKEEISAQNNNQIFQTLRDQVFYDLDSWSSSQQFSDSDDRDNQIQYNMKMEENKNKIQRRGNKINKQQKLSHISLQKGQSSANQAIKLMKANRPLQFTKNVPIGYLKIIKQKIFQISYLTQKFAEGTKQNFNQQAPWYCPSIITTSGKQYLISENKQLIYINEDLINGQKDSLRFIVKQVGANIIQGKSVMNVSLPVDIFQGRSLLERSAASFGCAPKFLKGLGKQDNVLQQMKGVTCFAFSVSPLQLIMQKPFNPILGQTFTAYIGGIPIYYEQISHHPPISSYYMEAEDFTIFGNLIAVADVGLNSGYGRNAGGMNIKMKNGSHFIIYFFPAIISGLIFGNRKFGIYDKLYVFEKKSRLTTEISCMKQSKGLYQAKSGQKLRPGDIIGGIFKVTKKFFEALDLFQMKNFGGLKKTDIEEKMCHLEGVWFQDLFIDGENKTKGILAYPIEYSEVCLPSDSNYRLDIMFHRIGDLARSQSQKQILQNQQRNDKKLRQKQKKKNK